MVLKKKLEDVEQQLAHRSVELDSMVRKTHGTSFSLELGGPGRSSALSLGTEPGFSSFCSSRVSAWSSAPQFQKPS